MKRYEKPKRLYVRGSATLSTKSLQTEEGKSQKSEKQVRIGLLGASGYTGAEVSSCMLIGLANCSIACLVANPSTVLQLKLADLEIMFWTNHEFELNEVAQFDGMYLYAFFPPLLIR